ncbi:hypothetical protein [Nitrobacter sp. JJSN]|uniref:hypothetical protein n=1 Tax=Nitrobacter sp. JJSN TaxID=3453033 RepID=UPI003F772F04
MNFIAKVFGKKTPNSTTIAAEIDRSTKERDDTLQKLQDVHTGLALMSDDDHRVADERAGAMRRTVARLEAGIAELQKAHDDAIIAEAEAERLASLDQLRARAEAARHAVSVESKALLEQYDLLAEKMAAVISRVTEIDVEVAAVNEALRTNRVAEDVPSVTQTWRKAPDQQAGERREKRPCWVHHVRHAEKWDDKWTHHDDEFVSQATLDENGKPIPTAPPVASNVLQSVTVPHIEMREVVVSRTQFRPGRVEAPLSGIHLPTGFAGGTAHWPRS